MELKIKDLYKSYDHGKTYAINDVSADFTPGIYGILGPNGAGKSTMFGMTAKQWRDLNPEKNGNIRDYATVNELICLSNMENLNAVFIDQGMPQGERLVKLNQIAIQQMRVLEDDGDDRKYLK